VLREGTPHGRPRGAGIDGQGHAGRAHVRTRLIASEDQQVRITEEAPNDQVTSPEVLWTLTTVPVRLGARISGTQDLDAPLPVLSVLEKRSFSGRSPEVPEIRAYRGR